MGANKGCRSVCECSDRNGGSRKGVWWHVRALQVLSTRQDRDEGTARLKQQTIVVVVVPRPSRRQKWNGIRRCDHQGVPGSLRCCAPKSMMARQKESETPDSSVVFVCPADGRGALKSRREMSGFGPGFGRGFVNLGTSCRKPWQYWSVWASRRKDPAFCGRHATQCAMC
jgi:hypothetical protein